jgi:hypothetical protein
MDQTKNKMRCKGKNRDGSRCKNNAMKGSKHCFLSSHCGSAPWRGRLGSLFTSYLGLFLTGFGVILGLIGLFAFWPRLDASISDPRIPGNPTSSSITATNAGLIPLDSVTISLGLKESCTRGTQWCNPPMFPDRNRYKAGLFTLGLKALGKHDLGIGQHLSLPIYPALNLLPSKAFPHPDWYVDGAIVIDYEVPLIHWKRHIVYPIYTGRLGEWLWG